MIKNLLQKTVQKAAIISSVITALAALLFFYLYMTLPTVPGQQAQASLNEVSNHDSCGKLQFTFSQNPGGGSVCAIGNATHTNSYTYTVKVTSLDGKSHAFVYDTYNYFCPEGYLGGANCLENGQIHTNVTGHTGDTITMTRTPITGSYCGRYQMDFKVTAVDGSGSCHFWGGNNTNAGSSGSCQTGVACGQNTCTPKTYTECEMGNATYCLTHGVPKGDRAEVTQNAACGYSCKDLGPCVTPTPTPTTTPTPTPTPHHNTCQNNACVSVVGAGANTCSSNSDCTPPQTHLTVVKIVNNNHGGTKQPADFVLRVNGAQVTTGVSNLENPGDYTVSEDSMSGYHQVSISGDCDNSGHVHLNTGDNKTCIIENEDNGTTTCTMPTCNTTIPGCSYPSPDTNACSCGPLVCITQTPPQNITVNVSQQQQQQQEVLAASVAPATQTSELPKTGAGAEVLMGLFGLLPLGWKLRKFA